MNELMLQEMQSQEQMLAEAKVELRSQAAAIPVPTIGRVVLTGSGDSGYAAMAVEDLYLERLGVPVWAVPSISAARYPRAGAGDVVVAISVSGEVIRTLEVARTARARGSLVLAVVANANSTLARESDAALMMPKPITRATPHTRDYTATLLALGVLGERLAESIWSGLDGWVESVGANVERSLAWASSISVPAPASRVWFLGSGPDRGTAAYGALKFWEAGGALSWWDDLEEFAHGSQLQARPGDDVVLLATGRTRSRAAEMVPGLIRMGMRPLVVTDGEPLAGVLAQQQFRLPAFDDAGMASFYSSIPVQAIAYRYACERGVDVLVPMAGANYGQTYEDVHNEWMRGSRLEPLT
jgi:glucosamine 6-phosphate synthetase-like amidotransferase/phosphosugar isomerase protein